MEERFSFHTANGDILRAGMHQPSHSPHGDLLPRGGAGEKQREMISLARSLTERGILALRCDFRYVGDASGKFADFTYGGEVENLRATYGFMQRRLPR